MRWQDIDEAARTWIVPAEIVKTKKLHCGPLSPRALELIEECKQLRSHEVWTGPLEGDGASAAHPRRRRSPSTARHQVPAISRGRACGRADELGGTRLA